MASFVRDARTRGCLVPLILLVDDRLIERDVLREILIEARYEVIAESESPRVTALVKSGEFDLIISDLSMAGRNGIELVQSFHRSRPEVPILIMTDSATIENALEAMKVGAFDCLKKPFLKDEFLLAVSRVIRNSRLARENIGLREHIQRDKDSLS